ncbi:hypothetical protein [Natronosalvus halobius]|nr:hypothetical protein [Natronosalvus halobius]
MLVDDVDLPALELLAIGQAVDGGVDASGGEKSNNSGERPKT